MTKKLTFQGNFKSYLLADQLQEALGWSPVTAEETTRLQSRDLGNGFAEVEIFADDDTVDADVQAVVNAHDPDELTQSEINQLHKLDAEQRFLLSQLANRSPTEIYTLMQNRIDSWTTLAMAKNDLSEWLPLLAAVIAWKVV